MKSSFTPDLLSRLSQDFEEAQQLFVRRFPGESGGRQPVHTVYGGAQLFKAGLGARLGQVARATLEAYAPDAGQLAAAVGLEGGPELASRVYERVLDKLEREPVEDFRIDFEDGYGNRTDEEEDGHAVAAAREVAQGMEEGTLPPFLGIRIKPFSSELWRRSVRTLDLFLTTLARIGGRRLPPHFVVTLPKVVQREQVAFLADLLDRLEGQLGVPPQSVKIELMVEMPQAIFGQRGDLKLPQLVEAARRRCIATHFGTYDYTASLSITAAYQQMDHPACDFAKHCMQVALAGTGIWLSDGATNVLPVAPHRAAAGESLSSEQQAENRKVVHAAWRLHYRHVRHSLESAYYQGWDLHPAQLPTRYAAVYGFFLESLEAAGERLANFVAKAAQATLVGDVFDDAATGQGLLNYFLRALNCGAVTPEEALERTGLTLEELRSRSFLAILETRRTAGGSG